MIYSHVSPRISVSVIRLKIAFTFFDSDVFLSFPFEKILYEIIIFSAIMIKYISRSDFC